LISKNENKLISRIIIGTAQLGEPYGISNKKKHINIKEQLNFLNFLYKNGFDSYDSAFAYKNSHNILGAWIKNNNILPNIYTKLPKLNNANKSEINDIFCQSLKQLNLNNIRGLFLHNSQDILNLNINSFIEDIKKNNKIKSFGISIYEEKDIYCSNNISIIQAPGNIFNQEIFSSDKINKLISNNIEIHIRSIFVQGLLFMNPNRIPRNLSVLTKPINYIQNIAKEIDVDISIICILCIKKLMPEAKLVIGFENISQVSDFLKNQTKSVSNADLEEIIKFGKKNSHKLWDPRNWN
tara:strand:+ start:209 stop:1096 length:888 start_codon:yes stop_codon:yes gene_type:complete